MGEWVGVCISSLDLVSIGSNRKMESLNHGGCGKLPGFNHSYIQYYPHEHLEYGNLLPLLESIYSRYRPLFALLPD